MKPKQDFAQLSEQYYKQCKITNYEDLEKALGITCLSKGFIALRVGWDDKTSAFTFPVHDENRKVIDIRRWVLVKKKVLVTTSKPGIVLSQQGYNSNLAVLLTKDEIECAAAWHLGFQAVAPVGCEQEDWLLSEFIAAKWLQKNLIQDIVIFSETDPEKHKNRMKFAINLVLENLLVRIAFPPNPFNSFKEWIVHKPSHEEISELIKRAKPLSLPNPLTTSNRIIY